MPPRFDDKLTIDARGFVKAAGALNPGEQVTEMCVWVIQRSGDGGNDAISNKMGPGPAGMQMPGETPVEIDDSDPDHPRWSLDLTDRVTKRAAGFSPGPASALAIGVFINEGVERALTWSEDVWLVEASQA